MRFVPAMLVVALFAACGPADESAEPAEMASGPTLADFAGTWETTAMIEGTEEPVQTNMSGSADGSDWVLRLEGRPDIPMRVSIVGDSLIGETTQYESILREGVMVTIRMASVLSDGALVGNLVATYQMPDGEEIVYGTTRGTRTMN